MKKPLVSVITTVYNCENFIERSLKSIFNQTFKDFEIIVFNDASTDKTWNVIEKTVKDYGGNIITINRIMGGNIGCAAGRNLAINRAKGKYIAIQDGDDISDADRLKKEVEFLENNADIFCVGSWAKLIDTNEKVIGDFDYPPQNHTDIVKMLSKMVNPIVDPSSMFRKNIFDNLGGYNEKWDLVPDLYLWVTAINNGYFLSNIPEILVYYRKHKDSLTARKLQEVIAQHKELHKEMITWSKKKVF